MKRFISLLNTILVLSLLVAGCATSTSEVVEVTRIVTEKEEVEVEKEVEVEVEVPIEDTATPAPPMPTPTATATPVPPKPEVLTLRVLMGDVQLNGDPVAAAEVEVFEGNNITTAGNALADLIYIAEEVMRTTVKSDSQLTVETARTGVVRLFLGEGSLHSFVDPSQGVLFTVATPGGEFSATGTKFSTDVSPEGDATILTYDGEVSSLAADGTEHVVSAGQRLQIFSDGRSGYPESTVLVYFHALYVHEDFTLKEHFSILKGELINGGHFPEQGINVNDLWGIDMPIVLVLLAPHNKIADTDITTIHEWVAQDPYHGLFFIGDREPAVHQSSINELLASYEIMFTEEDAPHESRVADSFYSPHPITEEVDRLPLRYSGALDFWGHAYGLGCADSGDWVCAAYENDEYDIRVVVWADSNSLENKNWDTDDEGKYIYDQDDFFFNAVRWLVWQE
jgi:hypothetical protein